MAFSSVKIGQTVATVKLLYLACITALTSLIYSSVYNVILATHWVIGEKQLTMVYYLIWNDLNCI